VALLLIDTVMLKTLWEFNLGSTSCTTTAQAAQRRIERPKNREDVSQWKELIVG